MGAIFGIVITAVLSIGFVLAYLNDKRQEIEKLETAIAWAEHHYPFIERTKPENYIPSSSIGLMPDEVHAPYEDCVNWERLMWVAIARGAYKPPKYKR